MSTSAKQQVPQTDRQTDGRCQSLAGRVYIAAAGRPLSTLIVCLRPTAAVTVCVRRSLSCVGYLLTIYKYKVRVHAGLNTHCTGVASVSLLSHTLSSHALAPCPAAQQPGHPLSRLVSSDQRDVLSLYFNALPRTTTKFSVVTHMDRGRVLAGQPHYCILQYNYCI